VHTKDFKQFIRKRDDALKHLHKPTAGFLICRDINTDYLFLSNWGGGQLASLLTTYNLSHKVNFATRIQNLKYCH